MEYTLDRIEGEYAVLEDSEGAMINMKLTELPEGVREGDVLIAEDGRCSVDADLTLARHEQMEEMFRSLF